VDEQTFLFLKEFIGKPMDGFKIMPMTEVYEVNAGEERIGSVKFCSSSDADAVLKEREFDGRLYRTSRELVMFCPDDKHAGIVLGDLILTEEEAAIREARENFPVEN